MLNFMSSRAAKQSADELKTIREDLSIRTEDGAAFPSESCLTIVKSEQRLADMTRCR